MSNKINTIFEGFKLLEKKLPKHLLLWNFFNIYFIYRTDRNRFYRNIYNVFGRY